MLCEDNQLNTAEEAASRALDLLSGEGNQFLVSKCHRLLGDISYRRKEERETAVNHYKAALGIASCFDWHNEQFLCHLSLADIFANEGRFSNAHIHIEHSKSHTVDNAYNLGSVLRVHACILHAQGRLEEAKSEMLQATVIFEKLGAAHDLEQARTLLQGIQEEMNNPVATEELDSDGELLKTMLFPTPTNSPFF